MKFFILVATVTFLVLQSCKSNNETESTGVPTGKNDSVKADEPYFPIASFIRNEIDYVDSLPVGIKKYHTRKGRIDSSYISPDEFHQLAAEFSAPELNDSLFRKSFRETSFLDKTSDNATFFYKAVSPAQTMQRIDVVTMKGDVYDEVKSIYIEKNAREGDLVTAKKLFWKPKRNFQIITITNDSSLNDGADIVKVVWDNRE